MGSASWQHNALQHDLASHLRGKGGLIVWEDMQLGPSGTVRPDVYVLPCSFARFQPMAYEVKISVSDFRRDVTSGKWQEYLKYACGVTFAVPAGLINKDDLPPGCGLIVRHDQVWRVAKRGTLQHLQTLPRNAWIKLLIDGMQREIERHQVTARSSVGLNEWIVRERLRKRHGDDLAALVSKAVRARTLLEDEITRDEELRKEIAEGRNRFMRAAEERAALERSRLDGELRDVAKVLGLDPANTSTRDLSRALSAALSRIPLDEEVKRLRNQLGQVIKAATTGLEALPGEDVRAAETE